MRLAVEVLGYAVLAGAWVFILHDIARKLGMPALRINWGTVLFSCLWALVVAVALVPLIVGGEQ